MRDDRDDNQDIIERRARVLDELRPDLADAYRRSWHAWFEVPAMVRAIVLDRLDDQRRP